jgi:hypothetical protein
MSLRSLWFEHCVAVSNYNNAHPLDTNKKELRHDMRMTRRKWKKAVRAKGLSWETTRSGDANVVNRFSELPHSGYWLSDGQIFTYGEPL